MTGAGIKWWLFALVVLLACSPRQSIGSDNSPTDGALAEGGIDMEELREAMHTYYVMAGWDRETGVPTVGKLQELDVGWAVTYLPTAR